MRRGNRFGIILAGVGWSLCFLCSTFYKKPMKKLVVVFLFLPLAGMAQFNKGQVFLGGSMSVQNQYFSNSKTLNNSFSILPTAGYFISEKWALGGLAGYGYSDQRSTNTNGAGSFSSKSSSFSISAGMFGRRYFAISERFFFVLEGNLNFRRGRSFSASEQRDANGNLISRLSFNSPSYNLGVSVRPLFIFFPLPKWGLEAGLGTLSVSRQENLSDHTSVNTSSLNVTGTFTFGITYYFKRI